ARLVDVLDAQLHRRNRRVLAEALRIHLIERRADVHVRTFRLARMCLRQEDGARAEVVAADLLRRLRLRLAAVGVADDGEVVTVGLERAERRRAQVDVVAHAGRRPQVPLCTPLVEAGREVDVTDVDKSLPDEGWYETPTIGCMKHRLQALP